jgi:hypothetical protein
MFAFPPPREYVEPEVQVEEYEPALGNYAQGPRYGKFSKKDRIACSPTRPSLSWDTIVEDGVDGENEESGWGKDYSQDAAIVGRTLSGWTMDVTAEHMRMHEMEVENERLKKEEQESVVCGWSKVVRRNRSKSPKKKKESDGGFSPLKSPAKQSSAKVLLN